MTVSLLTNVRAVLPDRIADNASIAVEGGRIVGVEADRNYASGVDGHGALCLPGLIDTHSDAIEKEITPRPAVELDESFALRSLEGRVLAAGITTVCHGIGFEDSPGYGRSVDLASRLVDVIEQRRKSDAAPVDHRILYRVPARSINGVDAAMARLAVGQGPGESPLLSFEDHTPGQGQFRDINRFKQYLTRARMEPGDDVDDYITRRIAEGEAMLPKRNENLARVSQLACTGGARVLVHDCEEAPDMDEARKWGAAVAEFPLSVGAARVAREHGMPVVMGAPNVLRGGSHSGNVDAEEVIRRGLCTSLASDYLPSSLLAAAFLLVERGAASLAQAVRLVTAGPTEVLGVADRGRIEVGARADLTLVGLDGRWPRVHRVIRASGGAIDGTSSGAIDGGLTVSPLAETLAG
ncbi:MAG: alpha-D-ribose 1-methylphosphonate 5-triphosphate diphosphatase [Acidimicrobiaceae bacterium]|nr:alpha-D-ribose 1-methylphosphonate 5-triphosphate diphosphatase [Acidimicrobiaceae bacterium]